MKDKLAELWIAAQEKYISEEMPDYENESTVKCAFNEGWDKCQEVMTHMLCESVSQRDELLSIAKRVDAISVRLPVALASELRDAIAKCEVKS